MTRLGKATLQSMLKTVLLTSLAMTVPIVAVRSLGELEQSELSAYDDFMRQRPVEQPDDRIVIMTIRDSDIEQLQQYPIHDGTLAQALKKLESYQPRAIGLDIARDVPQGLPGGRKQLAKVIESSETIVSGCLLSSKNHPGSPPAPGTPEGGAAFADFSPDRDQVVRRVRLVSTPAESEKPTHTKHICNEARADNELPSLSFQLAQMYLAGSDINPEPTANGEIQFRQQVLQRIHSHFGSYAHADVNDYQLMLNYRGAKSVFQEVSISDVLQDRINAQVIRDRVVLVGNASEVSKDFLSTPYIETQIGSRIMLGVTVHAHAVSQILSAVLDRRPLIQSWPEWAEIGWIWIWSLGSGLLAFYNRRLGLFLLGLIATGVLVWGICYGLFLYYGLWVPYVPALAAVILTALGVRLVDLATRSGYAQAIYEHLREQIQGNTPGHDRGSYLENLVQRARAVRQGKDVSELLATGAKPTLDASPAMKALYEQIAAQVRQDLAAEQSASQTAVRLPVGSKVNRLQALLKRAQRCRTQPSVEPPNRVDNHLPGNLHD